jgi:hypothetical protein
MKINNWSVVVVTVLVCFVFTAGILLLLKTFDIPLFNNDRGCTMEENVMSRAEYQAIKAARIKVQNMLEEAEIENQRFPYPQKKVPPDCCGPRSTEILSNPVETEPILDFWDQLNLFEIGSKGDQEYYLVKVIPRTLESGARVFKYFVPGSGSESTTRKTISGMIYAVPVGVNQNYLYAGSDKATFIYLPFEPVFGDIVNVIETDKDKLTFIVEPLDPAQGVTFYTLDVK